MRPEKRDAYQDIVIRFIINVKNEDYPDWKVNFFNTMGRISKMEDREKLIEKLKEEIKIMINKDEQGDIVISVLALDLTRTK